MGFYWFQKKDFRKWLKSHKSRIYRRTIKERIKRFKKELDIVSIKFEIIDDIVLPHPKELYNPWDWD